MKRRNIAFFIPHIGCPHRCSFCDQRAISGRAAPPRPEEVARVLTGALAETPDAARRAATEIAFFGGSFTAVDIDYRTALLETAARFVGPGGFGGIRVSTRPDCVGDEALGHLARYPVTAVELGAQSMDDRVLSLNGRGHTARDVKDGARRIREHGFSPVLQMMTGLPGDSDAGALETARALIALRPEAVRVYPTVVLRGTLLEQWMNEGVYAPPGAEETIPLGAGLLALFLHNHIPVIRFGLHAGADVEARSAGGAYHPALRELCEGELMLRAALRGLAGMPPGRYEAHVRPADFSRMTGQRRRNIARLRELGYEVRVRPARDVGPLEVLIRGGREGETAR